MKVKITSIPVQDQEKALQFYTTKLGFIKKHDVPLGEGNRWLTVVSKDEPDGARSAKSPDFVAITIEHKEDQEILK